MEQNLHGPAVYDFRQHDQLWRRVNPGLEPYPAVPAAFTQQAGGLTAAQESQLPGAEPNPCCMGTEAAELLAVLEGYIEEELEDWRRYLALSRQAPAWARQALRDIAEEENGHAGGCWLRGILSQGSATGPMWSGDRWTWETGAGRFASATTRRHAVG